MFRWPKIHRRNLGVKSGVCGIGLAMICCTAAIADTPLVSDNFNDNSINGAIWNVVTAGVPAGAAVVEQNQQIEFTGRGHLNTAAMFDPVTQAEQGLRITGQWTFVSASDFMQVLTRSDGTPGGGFGETNNGVEFQVGAVSGGNNMTIVSRGGAVITGLSNNGALGAAAGETFNFEIRDTGTNLYFTMTNLAGTKQRTVVATSLSNLATDRISFHNRESGNRSNLDNAAISSPSFLGPTNTSLFPILLQDNFDDNSLNATKWSAVTAGVPAGASVAETNSRLQMTGRGHLISAQQFEPTNGGLRIEGRWTFGSDDLMQVLTRSDGLPSGAFGETFNGIEFLAFDTGDSMSITQKVNGVGTSLASTSINITAGEVFDFLITDDGTNLLFKLTQVGGDGTTAQIVGASSINYLQDFLVFHNRESGRVAFLDDVVVSRLLALPEPTSIAAWTLISLGLAGFGFHRFRRK